MFVVRCGQDETRAGTAPPPIELRGTVRPAQASTLVAQVDGVVGGIGATEGGAVAAGAIILQLTNPAVERDAEVAAAQLALIDARLRRSGRPAPQAPSAPRQTLDITARILELRKARLEKLQSLRGTNDVTAGDLQQAEVEYLAALRDFNNERRVVAGAPPVADDSEILRLERQRVVAEQKFAAHRQSLLAIRSPFAGVLTRLHVTQGQPVYVRDPIADVADLSTLQVRAGIAPDLLRYVRPGMRVDVKILSTPVRTFADEIDAIIPATQATGADPGLPSVVITVPNPDASLQPNTEAIVTLRSVQ
jgi:multidrug resistance efflux pump